MSQVTQLAWSSIGRCLASASLDKTVRIWTSDNAAPCAWSCQAKLTGHSGRVTALRFVQDGRQLVTGMAFVYFLSHCSCLCLCSSLRNSSCSDLVHTSCMPTYKCRCFVKNNVSKERCHDAGSTDSTLRIWCCASWKCIKTLQGEDLLTRCHLVLGWLLSNTHLPFAAVQSVTALDTISRQHCITCHLSLR